MHIAIKVGIIRDERGGWLPGNSPQSLREQVHDNLGRLGLDVLDVVNLRTLAGIDDRATVPGELARQFEALAELQQQGLIRHLGLSTVSLGQLAGADRAQAQMPDQALLPQFGECLELGGERVPDRRAVIDPD